MYKCGLDYHAWDVLFPLIVLLSIYRLESYLCWDFLCLVFNSGLIKFLRKRSDSISLAFAKCMPIIFRRRLLVIPSAAVTGSRKSNSERIDEIAKLRQDRPVAPHPEIVHQKEYLRQNRTERLIAVLVVADFGLWHRGCYGPDGWAAQMMVHEPVAKSLPVRCVRRRMGIGRPVSDA